MSAEGSADDIRNRTVVIEKDVPTCPQCGRVNADEEFLLGWESFEKTTLRCPGCWYVFETIDGQAGNVVQK